jgi:hypothetical protein|tara:strand:- start:24183 stop:24308 length:126 start_codon:yes stop_codon:yes gene_type:complete
MSNRRADLACVLDVSSIKAGIYLAKIENNQGEMKAIQFIKE